MGAANPTRVTTVEPESSYTFFREIALGDPNAGPLGALNVALTPGTRLQWSPQFIALGTPLLLAPTSERNAPPRAGCRRRHGRRNPRPLRFDLFGETGTEARRQRRRQNHAVRAWVNRPSGTRPEALLGR